MRKGKLFSMAVVFLLVSFVFTSVAWACPGEKWEKDNKWAKGLPPGLQKKLERGKELPPPFQHVFKNISKNTIEGTIILVKEVAKETWIVIEGKEELKALKLDREDRKAYQVGDIVKVECWGDKIRSIKLVSSVKEELKYEFTVKPEKAVVGEKIDFKLAVTNPGKKDIVKTFGSGQQFDIVVKKGNEKVWQWSDGRYFTMAIQNLTFKAGKTVSYDASWKPEKVGSYTVEAYFLGESTKTPVAREKIVVAAEKTDLTYYLDIDPEEVKLGDEVDLFLNICNFTDKDITKTLSSSQVYDFVIKRNGNKVWQWSDDYDFLTALQNITVKKGEVIACAAEWIPKSTGDYTVEAYFLGEGSKPVATGEFKVIR